MPIILGIDPGVTGAMVWLNSTTGTLVAVMDHSNWCNHQQAYKELHLVLKTLWRPDLVVIEQQHARATRDAHGKVVQGIASTWNYAEHYGIILGCLTAYEAPIHEVDPAVWKANMHLDKDKKKSLELARKLWPGSLDVFKRVKDHGRAEAACIAYYGMRFLPFEVKRRPL